MTPDPFKLFLELQLALPRNGPGSRRATQEAFALLPSLPPTPRVLDLGCGQASEAFDLLEVCDGSIIAVDLFEPFLDRASTRATCEGIGDDKLAFERGDIEELEYDEESFDLIWSEGAVYLLGFERGLRLWRPFVKTGGFVVVSELTWLTENPDPVARAFWQNAYPGMGTIASNRAAAKTAGYEVLAVTTLPPEDWWTDYYAPMAQELSQMRQRHGPLAVLDEMREEITVFEQSPGAYSYVFYILKRI